MAAIITNKFRIHNQEQFVESFSESSPNVYYLPDKHILQIAIGYKDNDNTISNDLD